MPTNSGAYLRKLRILISQQFDLEEIRTLCSDLGVDYDNLKGEGKQSKIRELLLYIGREGHLPQLIILLQQERPPSDDWPPVPDGFQPPTSLTLDSIDAPAPVTINNQDAAVNINQIRAPFGRITERRIQAAHWKDLHEQSQKISKNLFELRGMISLPDDVALRILQGTWQIMYSDPIREFARFEKLADGLVRERFLQRNQETVWLINLSAEGQKMDNIINKLKNAEQLQVRMQEIMGALHQLEAVFGQILYFADQELKKTIQELNTAISDTDKMLVENNKL